MAAAGIVLLVWPDLAVPAAAACPPQIVPVAIWHAQNGCQRRLAEQTTRNRLFAAAAAPTDPGHQLFHHSAPLLLCCPAVHWKGQFRHKPSHWRSCRTKGQMRRRNRRWSSPLNCRMWRGDSGRPPTHLLSATGRHSLAAWPELLGVCNQHQTGRRRIGRSWLGASTAAGGGRWHCNIPFGRRNCWRQEMGQERQCRVAPSGLAREGAIPARSSSEEGMAIIIVGTVELAGKWRGKGRGRGK